MKRMLLLLAVAMVAVSCSGCGMTRKWNRGAACKNGCIETPAVSYGQPVVETIETIPPKPN